MSPQEQLDMMHSQEEKMRAMQRHPNERDLEASSNEFCKEHVSC